ncbi:putative coiled coil protein [Candidatus Ichthyocystis hellenicum]|uniref:Putative coiled coil protein n=1 Tax=Candidatus Ichthyocystis hellenicum TaxID=1561003 RepID=A0A0S4M5E4_9BURK|nr:hypothetical protein [Candidatus Ichthyocystis hellenicum]CUT17946.1 putative coiled coil protein [Candidatus Ichthyocystis hellenicum]
MRNVSNSNFSDEPVLAEEDINYQPEQPCCSGEHSLQNLHKSESTDSISSISDLMQSSSLDSGISGFMQIDCSFVDVDSNIISNLIYSIHSRNLPLYMSSVHLFLESCMNKSLRYLRLFKVEPLTSSEKIDFDPGPDRDEYIVRNAEEYGSLQYMCDYFKYYILGNCTEVVSPMDEFDVNCIKENDCVKIINTIKNKTDVRKCCQLTAKYGPSVEVPSIGTDYRILYTRNGHSLKLSIEKLIQNEVTDSNKKIVNKNFVLKYISPESGKILTNNRIARKIKSSTNNYVSTNDWYASSFIKYHLFINNKFEEISNAKNPIINDSTNMKSIIENKEELRNYDLKIRDILIRSFMRYYLSIKGKFKYICKSRFKGESEIITKEFELPVPEEYSLAAQKTLSDNHRCKINANMEVVRKRMSNYLSEYRHKESVEFYREGSGIIIRDRYKSYAIKFRNMGNMTASDFIFRNISSDKKAEIGKDILTHKSEDIRINSTYKTPPKSFNFISGINISSGITLVDPELVNHGDVADIICSLDNKDVPRYLDAMSNFTAKFMYKSLQYIRALKVELPNYDTTYLINPNMDEYISQNNGTYTRLQYMCDYFKYYILRSHLESLAYKRINIEEEILPLLTTTNDEEGKFKLQIGIDAEEITTAVDDEYELLMESIKVECLDLIENRKKLIDEINENKNKIRSSLRSLECSIRDELIKCLMEYYLLIVDKFESIATLEFKKINRPLNERLVLPVPQAVAEAAHKEIHTGEVLHNYYVRRRNNFFCDENTCLCTKSRVCNTHMVIKIHILEKVIDRMKEYMLSITIKDNGDIVHNSVQLFE